MEVSIGRESTKLWADFSGDFNPIHFDIDMARAAGSDELIVHGMNALLHVKQAADKHDHDHEKSPVHDEWPEPWATSTADWRQFKVVFRRPLPQERAVSIELEPRGRKIAFSLRDVRGSGDGFFKGTVGPAAAPSMLEPAESRIEAAVEPRRLKAKFEEFARSFPFVTRPWIFVDALVFSDFLGTEFRRLSLDFDRDGASTARNVVVQMSHRVLYDATAIDWLFDRPQELPGLTYTVARPHAFAQPGGEFGTVEITVKADERVVLQQEIGLLSRGVPH